MPDRPHVLVTGVVPDDLLDRLRERAQVTHRRADVLTADELAEHGDAVGWVAPYTQPVDTAVLDVLPDLRVIANVAVGHDNVDLAAAAERGIVVGNTPGVLDAAVAELVIGMVIALLRGIVPAEAHVRSGAWGESSYPLTTDVHGKTLGVLGLGRIGTRVARVARALEMPVLYSNRRRDPDVEREGLAEWRERDALFGESDVVLLTLPLTEQTRGSVGAAEFAQMKPTGFLVNVARGAIVDEDALAEAVRGGQIAGAALDVMREEPLPETSPLLDLDGVLLLPHIGSATVETRHAMAALAVDNVLAVLDGREPPAVVDPPA